jgi:hypothetical protein
VDTEFTEWDAQLAVAQLFRYRNGNTVIPSCSTFGWEMDVCVITPAHYLYEIEIKRTLSDWKAEYFGPLFADHGWNYKNTTDGQQIESDLQRQIMNGNPRLRGVSRT